MDNKTHVSISNIVSCPESDFWGLTHLNQFHQNITLFDQLQFLLKRVLTLEIVFENLMDFKLNEIVPWVLLDMIKE